MEEEQENFTQEDIQQESNLKKQLTTVTPLSKFLTRLLFILLFLVAIYLSFLFGFTFGNNQYKFPEKVVEVEKAVLQDKADLEEILTKDFNTKTTRIVLGELDEDEMSQIETLVLNPDELRHLGHLYFTDETRVYFLFEKIGDESSFIIVNDANPDSFVSLGGGDGKSNNNRYFYGIKNEATNPGKAEYVPDSESIAATPEVTYYPAEEGPDSDELGRLKWGSWAGILRNVSVVNKQLFLEVDRVDIYSSGGSCKSINGICVRNDDKATTLLEVADEAYLSLHWSCQDQQESSLLEEQKIKEDGLGVTTKCSVLFNSTDKLLIKDGYPNTFWFDFNEEGKVVDVVEQYFP